MESFLAMITPISGGAGGVPTPPIYYPPSVWPGPGYPAHPIAPGGGPSQPPFPTHPIAPGGTTPPWGPGLSPSPPGIWPSPGFPAHPIAPGGGPSQGPGFPTPPIYLPIVPPADSGLSPEHPIYIPVYPGHPIANVPTWEEIKDFILGQPPHRPVPATP